MGEPTDDNVTDTSEVERERAFVGGSSTKTRRQCAVKTFWRRNRKVKTPKAEVYLCARCCSWGRANGGGKDDDDDDGDDSDDGSDSAGGAKTKRHCHCTRVTDKCQVHTLTELVNLITASVFCLLLSPVSVSVCCAKPSSSDNMTSTATDCTVQMRGRPFTEASFCGRSSEGYTQTKKFTGHCANTPTMSSFKIESHCQCWSSRQQPQEQTQSTVIAVDKILIKDIASVPVKILLELTNEIDRGKEQTKVAVINQIAKSDRLQQNWKHWWVYKNKVVKD